MSAGRARRGGQAGEVQQRDEVIGRRHGVAVVGCPCRLAIAAGSVSHQRPGVVVEAAGPVEAVRPAGRSRRTPEVVHHVAAADDQHAALAQRREAGAELEVVVERLLGVDRQLHDRDVRVREHVAQHRPRAVIDAPAVDVEADPRRLDDLGDLVGQFGQPGRRVLDVEQLLGEAVEVVDRARPGSSPSRPWR